MRIISLTAVLLVALCAVGEESVRDLYERARLFDEMNHDLREAIRLYTVVVAEGHSQRALSGRAQYRLGVLYARIGRNDEAQRAFRTVVSEYADQPDLVKNARSRLVEPVLEPVMPLVKRTGPSADGAYIETFAISVPGDLLP